MRRFEPLSDEDLGVVADQLGRSPRGLVGVAWRSPCGCPGVIATEPRLPDGSPFPTFYYLTDPRAVAECSRLEAGGIMAGMTARLGRDEGLAVAFHHAHESYLADRAAYGEVPELENVSAGGMPGRVKCLHALVAHALAAGPGINPIGDEALGLMGPFWSRPCPYHGGDGAGRGGAS
ncbi:DUF501 domain-containing protein [uncultured Propionibacterium sp.]|uniref:DUF501 domain-containing protein n=1 Tax=uncultured Propionibacterium sp. TaxID=218066 RepID=UPI002931D4E4|nr:DUF501 domain-containing protein [uncultured Propionibacterium sp.]